MNKAIDAWKALEQSVSRLEAVIKRAPLASNEQDNASYKHGLERIDRLIHKIEVWRKSA